MPIETNKPLKMCKFCSKEYANLATHIINTHPNIIEQLEEGATTTQTINNTSQTPSFAQNAGIPVKNTPLSSINELVREKLETMFNIKILEMMSSNKDMSLVELKRAIEPQNTQLSDVIALHNAIYKEQPKPLNVDLGDSTSGWLELANNALPIVAQLLPQKQREMNEVKKNDAEHTGDKERSIGIRRLIPQEVTDNRGKSSDIGGKPSIIDATKQQDSREPAIINKGIE